MSKIKMRCITCGKWFQSANAKEVTCPDCMQKARKEKLAAKTGSAAVEKTPGKGNTPSRVVPPPPKPKSVSSGTAQSHWLDTLKDVKVGEPDAPPRPKLPSSPVPKENRGGPERFGEREGGNRGPGSYRENDYRGPGGYRTGGTTISGTIGQRPRQPMEGGPRPGPRPGPGGSNESRGERFGGKKGGKPAKAKTPKPPTPPKPKREKIPPPTPFVPTPEQVAQVEARYEELAVPAEYDGIRTQIAKELGIPKKAVKKIIKDLRERQGIPSWWELQTYKGDAEELEKIKAAYEPYLPVPAVGVHKKIAEELSLKPVVVYQAIKLIRQELNLPQYNDPALHGLELSSKNKQERQPTSQAEEKTEAQAATPASEGTETSSLEAALEDTINQGHDQPGPYKAPDEKSETTEAVTVTAIESDFSIEE